MLWSPSTTWFRYLSSTSPTLYKPSRMSPMQSAHPRNKASSHKAMAKLGISLKKLQKGLLLGKRWSRSSSPEVPEDVKQGHFAVIAEHGEEPRRFVIPLSFLTHPRFLKLLQKAADEYGFDHEGALTIPCRPSELETILSDQQWQADQGDYPSDVSPNWGTSERSIVRSY